MKISLQKVNAIFSSRYTIIAFVTVLTVYTAFHFYKSKNTLLTQNYI